MIKIALGSILDCYGCGVWGLSCDAGGAAFTRRRTPHRELAFTKGWGL